MGLTSTAILALSATITVALFALLNIKWKSLTNIWLRIGSQILVQVMLLVTIGLGLNIQNGFYGSWSDLFGIPTYANQHIPAKTIDLSKAQITQNGSAIIKETFTGNQSMLTSSIWLLIPKKIVKAIEDGSIKKYPVAMFLSGSPGVPTAWLHGLNLDDQINEAKTQVAIKDFIAVLPDYNILPHSDTGCMNIPNSVQVETWLIKDVYNYVLNNLPAEPNNWAVTGYSTGAWCSAMLALKNPEIFKAAAPIAGYYRPEFPFKIGNDAKKALKNEYNLVKLSKMNQVDIFILTSTEDPTSYKSSIWFHRQLGSANNVEILTVPNGGHNFSTWRPLVQDVLKWFALELR